MSFCSFSSNHYSSALVGDKYSSLSSLNSRDFAMQKSASEPENDFFTPCSHSDSERASDGLNSRTSDFICSSIWNRNAELCSRLAESSIQNSKNFTSQAPFDAAGMNEDFICTQRDLKSDQVESFVELIASWTLDSDTAETDVPARSAPRKFSKFREKFSPGYWKNRADNLWRRLH